MSIHWYRLIVSTYYYRIGTVCIKSVLRRTCFYLHTIFYIGVQIYHRNSGNEILESDKNLEQVGFEVAIGDGDEII